MDRLTKYRLAQVACAVPVIGSESVAIYFGLDNVAGGQTLTYVIAGAGGILFALPAVWLIPAVKSWLNPRLFGLVYLLSFIVFLGAFGFLGVMDVLAVTEREAPWPAMESGEAIGVLPTNERIERFMSHCLSLATCREDPDLGSWQWEKANYATGYTTSIEAPFQPVAVAESVRREAYVGNDTWILVWDTPTTYRIVWDNSVCVNKEPLHSDSIKCLQYALTLLLSHDDANMAYEVIQDVHRRYTFSYRDRTLGYGTVKVYASKLRWNSRAYMLGAELTIPK